ncbi:endo-1,4-beta-xylanase [Falsiroseomonas selenitidurans]|uniref:Beta-xylanase n=1 Tax=Falsiroseomonas selenitidurans TaxID=2716335 RepID=A0ABX1DY32_9PROT|nr:endo-1,4-beta-xylanase [Falsiroseomonas selenitidurans]NKC29716.1 endo-1,4-beta-xylanase [Falsiroseomonas selenitidurans]
MNPAGATRRALLALAIPGCAAAQPPLVTPPAAPGGGLHARAAAKGLAFGAALATRHLAEADLMAAFRADCGLLVAEYEMKWAELEPQAGNRRWRRADQLVDFARRNRMALRGHTLVWHESEPRWVSDLSARGAEAALARHVDETMQRWRGAIGTWDVVNEAVAPEHGRPDWLRRTWLLNRLGPDHIAQAFHIAHAADPAARLAYNDFGVEHATAWSRRRRIGILTLLRALRASGVPVHVLGVQAHLHAGQPFEASEWRAFLADVAALGLTIEITELDVNDRALPAAAAPRDAGVADLVRRFLDVTLAEPAVRAVVSWGLTDRHSWIREGRLAEHRRRDRATPRPLPYDEAMRRKPMWAAIAAALDAAPHRGPRRG